MPKRTRDRERETHDLSAHTLCCVPDFWDRVTGLQAAPPGWVIAVSAAVALLIVASPRLWRLARIAITIAHESGHALVSLLTGRKLEGIRLHADTSGETVSRGRRKGPGIVLTALAGYLTPPLLGVGAAGLLAAGRVTLLLALLIAALAAMLVMIRNWYGGLAVLTTAAVLAAVIWLAHPALRAAFAYAVAWFLLFGGIRPVIELARTRTRAVRLPPGRRLATGSPGAGTSDADQLGWLTGVPAGAWVTLFALFAVAALVVGARLLVPWPVHLPALTFLHGQQ
jgi:Peptidase M50B-like